MRVRIPERITGLAPYRPGRAEETVMRKYGLKRVAKLASNENPLGPSPLALEAMQKEGPRVHRYPVADGWDLRVALADRYGVTPDHIVLGNGTTDIIETLCLTFLGPEDNGLVSEGAFIMYRTAVQRTNGNVIAAPMRGMTHDLEAMARAVNPATRLLFIANPNNPTGTYNTAVELDRLLDSVPDDLPVVLDEAYYEFMEEEDYPDSVSLLQAGRENLVILRTFSKVHGLAGLRIGAAICHPDVTAELHRVRSPFNTSRIAQVAALAALDDNDHVARSVEHNKVERARVISAIEERGLTVTPSVGNFFLVDTGVSGEDFFEVACRQGIIVRPMRGYGFPTGVRISVGTREENDLLLETLDKVIAELRQ